ncbi:MAG: GTP cyclohydrolase I FolE [Flavobacteriales bacterium]
MMNNEHNFPKETTEKLSRAYSDILDGLGENKDREGLLKTPERVAKAMQYLTNGYSQDPVDVLKSAMFKEDYKEPVLVKNIEFYSLCEHHILPFFGRAHVAYIPNGHIVGLSKIPRLLEVFSRRLQVQERLTDQVCQCLSETLNAKGVAVLIEAQHMCMQMRGVETQQSTTLTTSYRGVYTEDNKKQDFLQSLKL